MAGYPGTKFKQAGAHGLVTCAQYHERRANAFDRAPAQLIEVLQ